MKTDAIDISISDDDIDWVENLLGYEFDTQRRDVIKNLDSIDTQAFPGTGKTTVLVAKLAIMARIWRHNNKGICVLSHTNTARSEIENRLGNTDVGRKLLSYPHFIGTIHSFFNTFIAIPWLRSKGNIVSLIDTDIVLYRRFNKLSHTAKQYLYNQRNYIQYCQNTIYPSIGEDTATYKSLKAVKGMSQKAGEFTFEEMLAVAREALENTSISKIIQQRFPFVFVDEAQDTDTELANLLENAYGFSEDSVILQNIGDINQAIFNPDNYESKPSSFPRENPLTITDSKRFSSKIAELANPMSINGNGMNGTNTRYAKYEDKHTVFLFERSTPDTALSAFAQHLLSSLTDEELCAGSKNGFYAVGQVGKGEEPENIPKSIKHYFPAFESTLKKKSPRPQNLVSYFTVGREAYDDTLESAEQVNWICKGISRLINLSSAVGKRKIPETAHTMSALLRELTNDQQVAFRTTLCSWQHTGSATVDEWASRVEELKTITSMFGITSFDKDFISWNEIVSSNSEEAEKPTCNVFHYTDLVSKRSININIGTIHSVKGETHFATLLLDTFFKKHNVSSCVDLLYGGSRKSTGKEDPHRRKCNYVALTRPQAIVCVALPKDAVDAECEKAFQIIRR